MRRNSETLRDGASVEFGWSIGANMDAVLEIARSGPAPHWTVEDFEECLRHMTCLGLVGYIDGKVVGFAAWELEDSAIAILNVGVSPEFRRRGVGTAMVSFFVKNFSVMRSEAEVLLREDNIPAQLFFKSLDFSCLETLADVYDDVDAYLMVKAIGEDFSDDDFCDDWKPRNRLTHFFRDIRKNT